MAGENPYAKYLNPGVTPPLASPPRVAPEPTPQQRSAEARAAAKEARDLAAWNAKHNPDGSLKPTAASAQATEQERKAGAFLIRALGSNESYEAQDIGPRSLVGQGLADTVPNLLNTLPGVIGNSPKRQVADSAQDEFIAASLRQDSGAAIPEEEMERQRRIYFPMPGDSEAAIEQKRMARLRAIEGLRQSAGRLEAGAEERYRAMTGALGVDGAGQDGGEQQDDATGYIPMSQRTGDGSPIPGVREPTRQEIYSGGIQWGDQVSDMQGSVSDYLARNYGVDPGEEAEINAFWNANRGNPDLTVEGVQQWYRSRGIGVPKEAAVAAAIEQAMTPGVNFTGSGAEGAIEEYKGQLDQVLERRGVDPESMTGTIGAKAAQGIMVGSLDEIGGLGGAVKAAVSGENPIVGYQAERDILRREQERASEANPKTAFFSELGGGLVTGGAGFGTAARAGNLARQASAAGNTARASQLARTATRSAAKSGATVGGLAGFNYGEGALDSTVGAALGAPAGALAGGLAQKYLPGAIDSAGGVLAKLMPRRPGASAEQAELIAASARQDIPLRQPDVRSELRGAFASAEQSETGGPIIRNAIQSDREAVEKGVRDLSTGQSRDEFALGEATQGATKRASTRMRGEVDAAFVRARNFAGDARVDPAPVLQAIDDRIAALTASGKTANAAEIDVLNGIRADLKQTGLTIDSIQAQRKTLRDRISGANMDPNRAEAGFIEILDTAGTSLELGLKSAGNSRAAQALKRANEAYRERRDFRDTIARQFVGTRNSPVRPELAATRFLSMVKNKGDYQRFSRMFREMEQGERDDFAATVAEGLGTKANGEFEYGKFLRDMDSMNPRAIRDLYGEEGIEALKDLRAIARAKSDTLAERNVSRTGGVVQRMGNRFQQLLMTAFGGAAGGMPGAVAGGLASGALEKYSSRRAARLLLNPDFTKWLRTAPPSPSGAQRHIARLDAIAARTPALSADILDFQRFVSESLAQSPMKVAAREEENN